MPRYPRNFIGPRAKPKKRSRARPARKPKVLANNASPGRVTAAPRKLKSGAKTSAGVKPHHVRASCSIFDPFCPAAKGARWPDETGGNTLTEQFRGSVTLSSDTNGFDIAAFVPAAPFGYLGRFGAISGGVGTFLSTATTYRASSLLATYGNQYRIVSFGVVIRCVASATTAAGLITLGSAGKPPSVSGTVTLGQELYDEVVIKAIQPGMELSWISKSRGPDSRAFVAQSTSTSFGTDWTTLFVEVSGGTTGGVATVNCEWFMNVEFNCAAQTALSALAKPNSASSPTATAAVSRASSTLGSFIQGGVKQVEDAAYNHLQAALTGAMADPLGTLLAIF